MDLKSGLPFWAIKNGLMTSFPTLQENLSTDIMIIGGGITGALLADHFSEKGYQVCLADKREIGWGSSAASTALLQYEIDTHLTDLAELYGVDNAVAAYQGCKDALTKFRRRIRNFRDLDFDFQQSLYYASSKKDTKALHDEFQLRTEHGFKPEWLTEKTMQQRFQLNVPAGILTPDAARVDPYRTAHKLLARVVRRGGQVFERSEVNTIEPSRNKVELRSDKGYRLTARYVIIAGGYETQSHVARKVAHNRSSYAFISDPLSSAALGCLTNTMVWESARPYLYMRTTGDNRLLVGGDDDSQDIAKKRDRKVSKKAEGLAEKVRALFPHLEFDIAFAWAGTFAETDDGLPFFGPIPGQSPRILAAMAYGGNGICYSVIGCELLQAWVEDSPHPLKQLFAFERADGFN